MLTRSGSASAIIFCYYGHTANEAAFTDVVRRKNTACPPLAQTVEVMGQCAHPITRNSSRLLEKERWGEATEDGGQNES